MCKSTATNGKIQICERLKYYLFLPNGNLKTPAVRCDAPYAMIFNAC